MVSSSWKKCLESTKTGNSVPDTGVHMQQQHGFVMCNSENMAEGSDSAAQDIFQWSRRINSELWTYFGFYKSAVGKLTLDILSAESAGRKSPLKVATHQIS